MQSLQQHHRLQPNTSQLHTNPTTQSRWIKSLQLRWQCSLVPMTVPGTVSYMRPPALHTPTHIPSTHFDATQPSSTDSHRQWCKPPAAASDTNIIIQPPITRLPAGACAMSLAHVCTLSRCCHCRCCCRWRYQRGCSCLVSP